MRSCARSSRSPARRWSRSGRAWRALTQPLVERLGKLTVIELDRDLAARLRGHAQLDVIESDVLKVDFAAAGADRWRAPQAARGGQPALQHLHARSCSTCWASCDSIEDQHFMLQKEVIDRMVARPATSDYGRLSVMLQWRYEMENVLFVPPESFDPPPRVDSAVVRMVPRAQPAPVDEKLLSRTGAGGLQPAPQDAAAHAGQVAGAEELQRRRSTCSAGPRKCRWPSTSRWRRPFRRAMKKARRKDGLLGLSLLDSINAQVSRPPRASNPR